MVSAHGARSSRDSGPRQWRRHQSASVCLWDAFARVKPAIAVHVYEQQEFAATSRLAMAQNLSNTLSYTLLLVVTLSAATRGRLYGSLIPSWPKGISQEGIFVGG